MKKKTKQEMKCHHELKCLPEYFQAFWIGDKTFEIRKNDRCFRERDSVTLMEWDGEFYTGRELSGFIRYITDFEQKTGYVVFSIQETFRGE